MWSPPLAIPYGLMAFGMTLLCVQILLQIIDSAQRSGAPMTVLGIGISYGVATLVAMFSGMPIAFALGAVAVVFMAIYMPAASLDTVTQNVYEEMASITLLSIPLFILKGAAIGKSRAGQDLYSGAACLAASRARRARRRQRVRLRAVRGDGRIVARDLLGDRLGRHPGNAQARLFRRLRGRHHRRRRHARHPAAAVDHHDPVRGRGGKIAGPAVPRRHRARPAAGLAVRRLRGDPLSQGIRRRQRGLCADRRNLGDPDARRFHHGGALQRAAAGAAVRHPADRRDDRALRRLRDAVGNRRARRPAGAGADRG